LPLAATTIISPRDGAGSSPARIEEFTKPLEVFEGKFKGRSRTGKRLDSRLLNNHRRSTDNARALNPNAVIEIRDILASDHPEAQPYIARHMAGTVRIRFE
jgi:hypothetical protein